MISQVWVNSEASPLWDIYAKKSHDGVYAGKVDLFGRTILIVNFYIDKHDYAHTTDKRNSAANLSVDSITFTVSL